MLAHFGDDGTKDLFRLLLEQVFQYLIDAEVTAKIGASLPERTETRSNCRSGKRVRAITECRDRRQLQFAVLGVETVAEIAAVWASQDALRTRFIENW